MLYGEFQDSHCGSHLRYQNGMILSMLSFHMAQMCAILDIRLRPETMSTFMSECEIAQNVVYMECKI